MIYPTQRSLKLACVTIALAALLSGCGTAGEAGTVPVTGVVLLDGQPLDQAAVAFIGKGGARLASATTDSAGKFTLNASLGKNQVTVAKEAPAAAVADTGDGLMPTDAEYAALPPPPKAGVPAKYADPKTSGLAIEVVDGMEQIELSLNSK